MTTLTYGTITRDTDTAPAASVAALLQEGFTHFLGNRVSSKVVASIKDEIVKTLKSNGHPDAKASDVTRDTVSNFREANTDLVASFVKAETDAMLAAFDAGTLGVSTRQSGPRESVDPIGAEMRKLAKARVVAILAGLDRKFPTNKDGKPGTITFVDGTVRTGEEMITKQLSLHGDAIRKEAEKNVRDRERATARVKADAAEIGTLSAEALGL